MWYFEREDWINSDEIDEGAKGKQRQNIRVNCPRGKFSGSSLVTSFQVWVLWNQFVPSSLNELWIAKKTP